ncbi:MAG: hypothetical protein AAGB00_07695 [Planctomycetota bacterium]
MDRRRKPRRGEQPEPAAEVTAEPAPKLERREKVNRRRQIDPTTCERDYSDAEVEFMNALDDYKRASGRMFPTCSEVLEVIRSLGYVQLSPAEIAARNPSVDTPPPSNTDAAAEHDALEAAADAGALSAEVRVELAEAAPTA